MFNIFIEALKLFDFIRYVISWGTGTPPSPFQMKNFFRSCYLRASENESPRSLAIKLILLPPKVFALYSTGMEDNQ